MIYIRFTPVSRNDSVPALHVPGEWQWIFYSPRIPLLEILNNRSIYTRVYITHRWFTNVFGMINEQRVQYSNYYFQYEFLSNFTNIKCTTLQLRQGRTVPRVHERLCCPYRLISLRVHQRFLNVRYGGTPRGNTHVDTTNKTMDKGSWSDQRSNEALVLVRRTILVHDSDRFVSSSSTELYQVFVYRTVDRADIKIPTAFHETMLK